MRVIALYARCIIIILFTHILHAQDLTMESDIDGESLPGMTTPASFKPLTIDQVIIEGNNIIPAETIMAKIPYRPGEPFLANKSADTIKLLYALELFNNISIFIDETIDGHANVIIAVEEKKRLDGVTFKGNKNLSEKEIEKKINFAEIPAIDEVSLQHFVRELKKLYGEKDFHSVEIEATLEPVEQDPNAVRAVFTVNEGKKTHVKRVFFKGNKACSDAVLRSLTFTREDWLFGFMDKAGSYQKDALDFDKYTIETFYQNSGFLAAQVTDIVTEKDPDPRSNDVIVTFHIDEGDLYTVSSVKAEGNDIFTEEQLIMATGIRPGHLYSRERVRQAMETLKTLWGEKGYIYAEVDPSVVPDPEKKTVDLEFFSSLGDKIRVNRINIIGNKKTRDHVIRRLIRFNEGELLTSSKMDFSKSAVESTGYFDPKVGVNWKIVRLDDKSADVNLILKERSTGRINAQVGFGGSDTNIASPTTSFNISANLQDINALGTGISYNFSLNYSAQDSSFNFDIFSPWLYSRPIGIGGNLMLRKLTYDDFGNTTQKPTESVFGGSGILRFTMPRFFFINAQLESGNQGIKYNQIQAQLLGQSVETNRVFQNVINNLFPSGNLVWLALSLAQDLRNHPVYASRGYQWLAALRWGIPYKVNNYGFAKLEIDGQWLTPLINEYDLVLKLHGFLGLCHVFRNYTIPYKELFHIGGPATVRGFEFGQIGPQFFGDSLGGTKAFVFNAELMFPIAADQSIRGVLFYDGGSGWDTTNPSVAGPYLKNNSFDFRHAIGFGIRLTQPTPIRLDVGFKLDRRKRDGEPAYQVHFGMNQEF